MACRRLPLSTALLLGLSSWCVQAQTVTAAPAVPAAAPASAAASAASTPRLPTAAESHDKTSAPGELRPERPVTPQISIPVNHTAPGQMTLGTPRPVRPGQATTGGVDDSAARCKAEENQQAQAACLDRVKRDAVPPPG